MNFPNRSYFQLFYILCLIILTYQHLQKTYDFVQESGSLMAYLSARKGFPSLKYCQEPASWQLEVSYLGKKKSIYVNDFESRQEGVLPRYPGHKGIMLKTQPKRQRTYRHIANSVSEIQMTKRCTWPFWGMVQWPFAQVKWLPSREQENQTLGSLKLTFLSSFSWFSSYLHGLGFSLPKNIQKIIFASSTPGKMTSFLAEQRETSWPRQFRPIGHGNRCLRPGHP